MSNTKMMACGHSANAKSLIDGSPCCAICTSNPKAREVVLSPDLTGREAHCGNGPHAFVNSSTELGFFKHRPEQEYDTYYCGCGPD